MLSYLSYPPTRNNRGILKHVQSLPPRHQHRLSVHSVQRWFESHNCGRLAFYAPGRINSSSPGDLNNHDPLLGPLQNNGVPTQTMALLHGSPAIDGGNPAACTDGLGNLLKTDQRGMPRPDQEDTDGCDMGAFENQSD